MNKWPFITLKAHGPHSVRTQMTDSNLALTQVANKLYKINFKVAFQSSFPSRVILEKKNLSKNWFPIPRKNSYEPSSERTGLWTKWNVVKYWLTLISITHLLKDIYARLCKYYNPPPPTHQMTSEYPLQTKQCHVYFILFKTKLFLLGKIFGTLDRGIGSSNEKKTIYRTLYNILNYF